MGKLVDIETGCELTRCPSCGQGHLRRDNVVYFVKPGQAKYVLDTGNGRRLEAGVSLRGVPLVNIREILIEPYTVLGELEVPLNTMAAFLKHVEDEVGDLRLELEDDGG